MIEYQLPEVEALAAFWEKWEPQLEASLDKMDTVQRMMLRSLLGMFSVDNILAGLDQRPDLVAKIKATLIDLLAEMTNAEAEL